MKVQVLGYWGTYPAAGEATTGFLLHTDSQKILVDCGSGVLAQLLKVGSVEDLDAVVITHHHHDHVADLGVLGYALLLSRLQGTRERPLPVYLPRADTEAVATLEQEAMASLQFLDERTRLELPDVTVRFTQTTHPVYCLAPRFESVSGTFVFSADSAWNEALIEHARNADLFVCEASMYRGMESEARQAGHLTSTEAGRLALAAGVKRLALTHYPHYGNIDTLLDEASEAFEKPVERLHILSELNV